MTEKQLQNLLEASAGKLDALIVNSDCFLYRIGKGGVTNLIGHFSAHESENYTRASIVAILSRHWRDTGDTVFSDLILALMADWEARR